jgi:general stress protein 26
MTHIDHQVLNETVHRIVDEPPLSILATTDADGKPQTSVVYIKRDGDDILFSTIKGRRKTTNMGRDSRVNLLVRSLPE